MMRTFFLLLLLISAIRAIRAGHRRMAAERRRAQAQARLLKYPILGRLADQLEADQDTRQVRNRLGVGDLLNVVIEITVTVGNKFRARRCVLDLSCLIQKV
jgi:hypothetical protein